MERREQTGQPEKESYQCGSNLAPINTCCHNSRHLRWPNVLQTCAVPTITPGSCFTTLHGKTLKSANVFSNYINNLPPSLGPLVALVAAASSKLSIRMSPSHLGNIDTPHAPTTTTTVQRDRHVSNCNMHWAARHPGLKCMAKSYCSYINF